MRARVYALPDGTVLLQVVNTAPLYLVEAERIRRTKRGEADGVLFMMTAEADGLKAILTRKAAGFQDIVKAAENQAELAALLLITEQLPALVEAQVKAISNLKIDQITVWEGGRKADGKTSTADFLSGMVGALPPLHELTRNVGIDLPQYLGKVSQRLDQAGTEGTAPAPIDPV